MLSVTDQAVAAVRGLTAASDVPAGTGLRISGVDGDLRLSVSASPHDGDAVVHVSDARIFVDPAAERMLDGKVLDAHAEGSAIQFTIAAQS